jgi:hypothetical protein
MVIPKLIGIVMVMLIASCCGRTSAEGTVAVRKLSMREIASLYERMASYNQTPVLWGKGGEPLPIEFVQAGAIQGEVGRVNQLVFGGCMDDKTVLLFEGLGEDAPGQVVLIAGEGSRPEILWTATDSSIDKD